MNSFGNIFRVQIFGESHGATVGIIIDGMPAGLALTEENLLADLEREKKEMAIKQNELAIQTRKLNQLVIENQQTKDFFDTNKKKILKEAKLEVDQLLKSANKLGLENNDIFLIPILSSLYKN